MAEQTGPNEEDRLHGEGLEELPDDLPASKPAGATERNCPRCGRQIYLADGSWWHLVGGAVDCPDASKLFGTYWFP
jgi:hypothetical protein